ncbi:MAG: VPLPA-CTERM sorting domain-containing protein [Pseudomonadota bacterium]
MKTLKNFGLAAALTMGSTISAQAGLIDFTDPSAYSIGGASGSGTSDGGIDFSLSAVGGSFNNSEAGPGPVGPLLGAVDGLGIGDDEITNGDQSVTVSFDETVTISSLFFLDLFGELFVDGTSDEGVTVTTLEGDTSDFMAQTLNQDGTVGFGAFTGLGLTSTSFTFAPMPSNDAFGAPDFALAGITVAPIPLPAGILLLGGALAGLGFARRAKKASV